MGAGGQRLGTYIYQIFVKLSKGFRIFRAFDLLPNPYDSLEIIHLDHM